MPLIFLKYIYLYSFHPHQFNVTRTILTNLRASSIYKIHAVSFFTSNFQTIYKEKTELNNFSCEYVPRFFVWVRNISVYCVWISLCKYCERYSANCQKFFLLWNLIIYHGTYMIHNFNISCQIQWGFTPKTDFGNIRYNHYQRHTNPVLHVVLVSKCCYRGAQKLWVIDVELATITLLTPRFLGGS